MLPRNRSQQQHHRPKWSRSRFLPNAMLHTSKLLLRQRCANQAPSYYRLSFPARPTSCRKNLLTLTERNGLVSDLNEILEGFGQRRLRVESVNPRTSSFFRDKDPSTL